MSSCKLFRRVVAVIGLCASLPSSAQTGDGYRFVLETDRSVAGAKLLTDDKTAQRYLAVSVRSLQMRPGGNPRMLTDGTYAVDCRGSRRIVPVQQRINRAASTSDTEDWVTLPSPGIPAQVALEELPYVPLVDWLSEKEKSLRSAGVTAATPDAVALAVAFSCMASPLDTAARDALAERLRATADTSDLVELECSYSSPGGKRYEATVGFSEARRYVRWGGTWSSGATTVRLNDPRRV